MNPAHLRKPQPSLLNSFFFSEEVPFGAAVVRMLMPLAAGIPLVMRFPRIRELYTTDGTPTQLFELFGQGLVLPVLSPWLAVPLYGMLLLAMFCAIIGFRTRSSLIVATVLYPYFSLLDGISTMTKYSVISTHILLLLALSNCGAVWSVDAWLKRRSGPAVVPPVPPRFAVWPVRLMQLLFAFIYFGAAITKIQTEAFFSGEQMRYWMLSNWNYENPVGEVMAMWSPLLLISAYLAVVWEILFGFLVWQPRTRLLMLAVGVLFHFMTWLTLGLYVFPAICVSCYFAFMMEADVLYLRHLARRLRLAPLLSLPVRTSARLLNLMPQFVPASVAWICLLAAAAMGASELEIRLDLYGRNAAPETRRLQPVDAAVARTMLQNDQRVRQRDKFFSFDIGTSTVGGQLANRKNSFTYGQTMIAQINLNPPHEDMWVECVLEDDAGRIIEQFGQFMTRDMLRANFTYEFGNRLVPGHYNMVLKNAKQEIYRRGFELTGKVPADAHASTVMTN
ncbi:MAG: HTTM domain-containing protein [Planctomycetaceae bacterium]